MATVLPTTATTAAMTTSATVDIASKSRNTRKQLSPLRERTRRASVSSDASSELSETSSVSSTTFLLPATHQPVRTSSAITMSWVPSWVMNALLIRLYSSAVFHRVYKWFKTVYRLMVGTSEIQRICTPKSTSQFISLTSVTNSFLRDNLNTATITTATVSSENSNDDESTLTSIPLMRTGSSRSQYYRRILLPKSERSHQHTSSDENISLLHRYAVPIAVIEVSASTVYRVDRAILYSSKLMAERRQLERADGSINEAWRSILRQKHFPDSGIPTSPPAIVLRYCLKRIAASYRLMDELNTRANTKYDSTIVTHERKLLELWDLLMPHEKLNARHSTQWQKIGFQGKDPATDFRSMGMLALDDLHYYAKHHTISAHHVLQCSRESDRWYSFAIVGIHITSFAVQTLRTRRLQHHLYRYGTSRDVYHEYYSYLFHSFNEYWMSRVPTPTIMDFERVFVDFRLQIETELLERRPTLLNESFFGALPKEEA